MNNRFWICCMKKVLKIGKKISSYLKYGFLKFFSFWWNCIFNKVKKHSFIFPNETITTWSIENTEVDDTLQSSIIFKFEENGLKEVLAVHCDEMKKVCLRRNHFFKSILGFKNLNSPKEITSVTKFFL